MNDYPDSHDEREDSDSHEARSEKMQQKKTPKNCAYSKKRQPVRRGIKQRRVRRSDW